MEEMRQKKSVSDLPRAMFLAVEVLVWKGSWGVSIQTSLQSRNPLLKLLRQMDTQLEHFRGSGIAIFVPQQEPRTRSTFILLKYASLKLSPRVLRTETNGLFFLKPS